jgi:hypothetical protein
MTEDIVRAKIREALTVTGNNRHDAQKLLITWAVRDQQLLLGFAKPHLKAIIAGFIDHTLRDKGGGAGDQGPDNFSQTAIDDIVQSARLNVPQDKRRKSNLPPPKSTERQASTMRKLAAAFTKKKK